MKMYDYVRVLFYACPLEGKGILLSLLDWLAEKILESSFLDHILSGSL